MTPLSPELKEAMRETSRPLAESMLLRAGDVFTLTSRSRPWLKYEMTVVEDLDQLYIVHDGQGCEGERFFDVQACWHTQEPRRLLVTTETKEETPAAAQAVAKYEPNQALVPERIDFTDGQMRAIANVICRSGENVADRGFVSLFVATCKHSGLDPFLKQIYALNIKGRWTMFVAIDGYRVIGERTGLVDGLEGPYWSDDGKEWHDYPFVKRPRFCKVSIWRKGARLPFTSVCSMDAYFQEQAGNRWEKDAPGMLAKCTEAQAWRRAFPANMAVIPHEAPMLDEDEVPTVTYEEQPSSEEEGALEGQWSEVPASDSAPGSPAIPEPVTDSAATRKEPASPVDLLNALVDAQGTDAGKRARAWAAGHFPYTLVDGSFTLTKLSLKDRAAFAMELRRRRRGTAVPDHEPDQAYTAAGVLVCRICDVELPDGVSRETRTAEAPPVSETDAQGSLLGAAGPV